MTHQNTETLKQWFAEQVEFAKSTVEYWQELATIARGEVVALQARVKELESQLYSTRVTDVMNLRARIAELEARDKVKAEEYDTRIMLANHLEIERDELTKRIAELKRERDEALAKVAELRGMDTPWPLCDVIRTLRYATSHLLQYHDCDCGGWESYAGALEESDRYEKMLRKGGA